MKCTVTGIALAGILSVGVVLQSSTPVFGQTTALQAPRIGEGQQDHPPGHQITADHKGNVYVVQAELTGADGKSGGTGAYKWLFKGYTPATK